MEGSIIATFSPIAYDFPGKAAAALFKAASPIEDVHLRLETYLLTIVLLAEGNELKTTIDLFERCIAELKQLKAAGAEAFAKAKALRESTGRDAA